METNIELTASARLFAERAGLLDRLEALRLGEWVAKGDLVELTGAGKPETFAVLARHIRAGKDGRCTLVLLLDHPIRSA
ncbi:hypothetical protein [Chelativorans sp. AA-79]|uniref:hypothetical protein n=1 Tax=Chelativorans sp. AA-79 TaxID=3028735 RepID=UPI0023F7F57C|nr:hypothetical protein [Chelativorans sp. AA-79]WEX07881.1 hypothetical protein PVE73_17510 [Chelativorans sp. AA-79]